MGGVMDCSDQVAAMLVQAATAYGIERLQALPDVSSQLDPALLEAILDQAGRFAAEQLAPFDRSADRVGCQLEKGRVVLAPAHEAAWTAFHDGGWAALDVPENFGGQGLPVLAGIAVQELMDRFSITFGMATGASRSASRLLQTYADPELAEAWVANLASGAWSATICISEPEAGSDVGRIRTAARRAPDGTWRITGEKIWISYGDHTLTERIGHVVLARPEGSVAGTRGLSLFLVAAFGGDEGPGGRNGVVVRRLEDKLGLHGSPTCALGFEDAEATMIGVEGRGLPQLFRMIVGMRLQVGTQGLGLANASFAAASRYAQERRQGGPAHAPAVLIADHADVQLMLAAMAARIATLRGIVYAAAVAADLADRDPDETARRAAASLLGWLLPIVKNSAAETAFEAAAEAILVFGGAGYTTEWPVERYLRDARILAIYEGTTGMQAIDLVRRRWLGVDCGYEAFRAAVEPDLSAIPSDLAEPLRAAMATLTAATAWLRDPGPRRCGDRCCRPAGPAARDRGRAWLDGHPPGLPWRRRAGDAPCRRVRPVWALDPGRACRARDDGDAAGAPQDCRLRRHEIIPIDQNLKAALKTRNCSST